MDKTAEQEFTNAIELARQRNIVTMQHGDNQLVFSAPQPGAQPNIRPSELFAMLSTAFQPQQFVVYDVNGSVAVDVLKMAPDERYYAKVLEATLDFYTSHNSDTSQLQAYYDASGGAAFTQWVTQNVPQVLVPVIIDLQPAMPAPPSLPMPGAAPTMPEVPGQDWIDPVAVGTGEPQQPAITETVEPVPTTPDETLGAMAQDAGVVEVPEDQGLLTLPSDAPAPVTATTAQDFEPVDAGEVSDLTSTAKVSASKARILAVLRDKRSTPLTKQEIVDGSGADDPLKLTTVSSLMSALVKDRLCLEIPKQTKEDDIRYRAVESLPFYSTNDVLERLGLAISNGESFTMTTNNGIIEYTCWSTK